MGVSIKFRLFQGDIKKISIYRHLTQNAAEAIAWEKAHSAEQKNTHKLLSALMAVFRQRFSRTVQSQVDKSVDNSKLAKSILNSLCKTTKAVQSINWAPMF